jgi:hypothetical protein
MLFVLLYALAGILVITIAVRFCGFDISEPSPESEAFLFILMCALWPIFFGVGLLYVPFKVITWYVQLIQK